MKQTIIAAWLVGAVGYFMVAYEERCSPASPWYDVPAVAGLSLGWPFVAAGRLGMAAWNPHYALAPLGCRRRQGAAVR